MFPEIRFYAAVDYYSVVPGSKDSQHPAPARQRPSFHVVDALGPCKRTPLSVVRDGVR
jgi:hypothetical protein